MSDAQYQLLPPLSADEFAALKADIREHGVQVPVLVDEHGAIIDGHHRHQIATDLGIEYETEVITGLSYEQKRMRALALNMHRRQLTADQRATLHAQLRAEGMSFRDISRVTQVDPKTVRNDLSRSAGGEYSPPAERDSKPSRVTGLDGRSYPASRPRPTSPPPVDRPPAPPSPPQLSSVEREILDQLDGGATAVVSYRCHQTLIGLLDRQGRLARVDRRTDWGNPFEMPGDGDRAQVIAAYRDYYLPHKPSLLRRIGELTGKALACWCAPEACHADVLAEVVNGESDSTALLGALHDLDDPSHAECGGRCA